MADSYLAIARKYRPATFDEIVGQDHVTRTLRNAINGGRVHHAFLFCGARGVGKTTAARALARSLNCEKGPTPEPCGECVSCREVISGVSPDLIEIDGASNNSVDDIRDLRETVHYAPTRGRYKIYLVDEVHMLSKPAFNALLKTLEEPPPHVVFIFATTEPNKILDTILSRVQRFDFKRIGTASAVERLQEIAVAEGATLTPEALRRIARAGEGSMRDAQSLLDKVISFGGGGEIDDALVAETLGLIDRDLLYGMFEGLLAGQPDACLASIAQVYEYGFELSQFTSELMDLLRDATLVALSPDAARYVDVPEDELERLKALVEAVDAEALSRLFSALLDVHDQVARAGRPRIVLEMAVARLATVRPVHPVGELVARLETLERSLRKAGGDSGGGGLGGGRSRPSGASRGATGRRAAPLPRRTSSARPAPAPAPMPGPPEPPSLEPRAEPVSADPVIHVDEVADPWSAVADAWKTIGQRASHLASGRHALEDGVLTVTLPAGRLLAEARRATEERAVHAVVERYYPPGTRLEVRAQVGTGSARDQQAALQRQLMEDPPTRRVIDALGAQIERVTALTDGEDE